jgi:hypothetical protein
MMTAGWKNSLHEFDGDGCAEMKQLAAEGSKRILIESKKPGARTPGLIDKL